MLIRTILRFVRSNESIAALLLATLGSTQTALALEILPDQDDLAYRETPTSIYDSKVSAALGAGLIELNPKQSEGKMPFFHLDRVYTSPDLEKAILVKYGVRPEDRNLDGKLIKVDGGYLYHRTLGQSSFAAYLLNFSADDAIKSAHAVEAAYSQLHRSETPKIAAVFGRKVSGFFLSSAYASSNDECTSCREHGPVSSKIASTTLNVQAVATTVLGSAFVRSAFSCFKGVFQGGWDASGGLAIDAMKALSHPVQSARKYWSSAKAGWGAFKAFIADIEGKAKQLYGSFSTLDPEIKAQLVCRIAGMIGAGALMTYFTVGAGGPRLLKLIADAFAQVEKMPQFARVLGPLKVSQRLADRAQNRAALLAKTTSQKLQPFHKIRSRIESSRGALALNVDKQQQLRAIRQIRNLKLDLKSLEKYAPADYNDVLMRPVYDLVKLVQKTPDPEIRKAALEAMFLYGRNTSGNYQKGFIGAIMPDNLQSIYDNLDLPDDIRKLAYDEMIYAYKRGGIGTSLKNNSFKPVSQVTMEKAAHADAEARKLRQMEEVTQASRRARPTGETLSSYAAREGYEPTQHVKFKGMQPIRGATNNIGHEAIVTYTPHGKTPMEIRGVVVEEYQTGMRVRGSNGVNYDINVLGGNIGEVFIKP